MKHISTIVEKKHTFEITDEEINKIRIQTQKLYNDIVGEKFLKECPDIWNFAIVLFEVIDE